MSTLRILLIASLLGFAVFSAKAETQTEPQIILPGSMMGHGDGDMAAMDRSIFFHGILDQAEGRIGGGQSGFRWSGQAWIGTDYDKLWLKSEGFALGKGGVEDGQNEVLYSRAVSTFLDLQAGLRTDWDSGTGRTWAALGVQGLAPLFFDYEVTGYLSDGGHAALKLAGSYDLLITQRLILQPNIEMNFYSKADLGRRVGAGLSDIDAGLRLRYEISRKFAPYVGVAYVGRFGETARFARQEGEGATAVQFVFGIRSWF
ncbi:MAG: copper resistance protein B [Rhodospirillales bacterium]|nr:copper resistance protein B [Rhodospirillales bacterium]